MGSPGVDESATGQSWSHLSSSQPPSPWPWPPPSQMTPRHPALTPMLPLTPGMATTAMVDFMEDTEDTTPDLTDITATTARDLLMRLPPLSLAPTPMLMPMPGMATTVMDTEVTTVATTDLMLMATTARDLPMRPPPLSLDPTPRPTLTRGIPTMEDMAMELTDLMDIATMATVLTVTLTGDKK